MNHHGPLTGDYNKTQLPTNDMRPNDIRPPSYGGPQRDAINSVVDNIVGDLCGKIGDLRKTLDEIEQQVLEGAAGAKGALHDHIAVCIKVNDQIARTRDVVEEIKTAALAGR